MKTNKYSKKRERRELVQLAPLQKGPGGVQCGCNVILISSQLILVIFDYPWNKWPLNNVILGYGDTFANKKLHFLHNYKG